MSDSIDIEKYRGMALKFAAKFADREKQPVLDTEVYADACVGLVKAIAGFDETRGFKFATYARHCIKNEVGAGLYRRRNARSVGGVVVRVRVSSGIAEMARDSRNTIANDMQQNEDVSLLRRSLEVLPERSRYIIDERMKGKTLEEIGELLGLSRERVNKIEKQAHITLRQVMLARSA
jgi:RNA polymerase sigma factor (sigma-70 family)